MSECLHSQLLMQLFERTHHIIGTHTMSDVKFCFNFLCSKIQKFSISNLKNQNPIKLALVGSDAYVNSFVRIYVELLSTKSPDWQGYLRFYMIPSIYVNNYSSSSLIHKYIASIDPLYSNYFLVNNSNKDPDSSRDNSADGTSYAHELYNKVVNYLKSAQYVLQIPIAEAMITYKDKNIEDESSQVFIPFICDARIGNYWKVGVCSFYILNASSLCPQVWWTAFMEIIRLRTRKYPSRLALPAKAPHNPRLATKSR